MKNIKRNSSVSKRDFFYVIDDNYNEHAELALPGYIELHSALNEVLLSFWKSDESLRALDLGIGTGKTTATFLELYPHSTVIGIDKFQEMLNRAKKRLNCYGDRIQFQEADFMDVEFPIDLDVCFSAFAIHHQPSEEKQKLFSRIYKSLVSGGVFCMIDWIKFEDSFKNEMILATSERHVRKMVPESIAAEWIRHWTELNCPDTEGDINCWLNQVGFSRIFTAARIFGVALIYAIK